MEVSTWENPGRKQKKYFDYQKLPPTGRIRTKKGKGKYEHPVWGKVVHHTDGRYYKTLDYSYQIPLHHFKSQLLRWYKDELKSEFTQSDLEWLGKKESPILDELLKDWKTHGCINIYDNRYYIFETVTCGLNVTQQVTDSYQNQLRISSPPLHTMMWFNHLGYKPRTLIDVGCGIGLSSIWFAYNFPDCEVYVDEHNELSVRLIERVKKELQLFNLHIGDKRNEYDCGTFYEVVEHIEGEPGVGTPFPWLDNYLHRINHNFTYSTYWSKNESSIGHFNQYEFDGVKIGEEKKSRWSKTFHKSLENRDWIHDKRCDFHGTLPNVFWMDKLKTRVI